MSTTPSEGPTCEAHGIAGGCTSAAGTLLVLLLVHSGLPVQGQRPTSKAARAQDGAVGSTAAPSGCMMNSSDLILTIVIRLRRPRLVRLLIKQAGSWLKAWPVKSCVNAAMDRLATPTYQ